MVEFAGKGVGKGWNMNGIAIRTEQLTRRFGALTAVDSVDLRVSTGQFFGFLGPNGAGKSTTIKMLTGLLAPSSGRMELLGVDFQRNPIDVKRQIGVVPEGMGLFERLTGSEYLHFVGRMYGLAGATTEKRAGELLEFMQLADREKTLIADYSHGMQKKLALAAAVIHGPRILFLDEPFEGVDALAAGALKALLGADDRARRDYFSDFARAGNCGATVQPRGHYSSGGDWWRRGHWKNCARAFRETREKRKRLSRFSFRLWGQSGGEQARLEELTWLT